MFAEDEFGVLRYASTEPPEPEILYQYPPRRYNTYTLVECRRDWCDSLETYQNAAKKEYDLLMANYRQGNHFITLKYFCEFYIVEIRSLWSKLKARLREKGIIAFTVIEITTRRKIEEDRSYWDYPINCVHYHFMVFSALSEKSLRGIFNDACIDVGLKKSPAKEFEIHYYNIPNRKEFEHKARYMLKYGEVFEDQVVLFRPGTQIWKTDAIGPYFINADGTQANKTKMYDALVASWYTTKIVTTIVIQLRGETDMILIQIPISISLPTNFLRYGNRIVLRPEIRLQIPELFVGRLEHEPLEPMKVLDGVDMRSDGCWPVLTEIAEVLAYGGREDSGQLERLHEEIQSNIDRTGECPEIRYMIDVFDSPTGEGKVICRTHHSWKFECSTPHWGRTTATVDIWVAVHGQDP